MVHLLRAGYPFVATGIDVVAAAFTTWLPSVKHLQLLTRRNGGASESVQLADPLHHCTLVRPWRYSPRHVPYGFSRAHLDHCSVRRDPWICGRPGPIQAAGYGQHHGDRRNQAHHPGGPQRK